jgi:guanylate kinase
MLFVISAPSGAGKTTIIKELFKIFPDLKFSVSATTRKKRESETEGIDYHFISAEEFESRFKNGEFVECEEVFGNRYGTLKSEVEPYLNSNTHLIFDVDVKCALSIKKLYPQAVSVFVDVPVDELVKRLKKRETESDEEIEKRRSRMEEEIKLKSEFDYAVDNSKGIETAVKQVSDILNRYKK